MDRKLYGCVSLSDWLGLVADYYEAKGGVVGWLSTIKFDFSVGPGAVGQ